MQLRTSFPTHESEVGFANRRLRARSRSGPASRRPREGPAGRGPPLPASAEGASVLPSPRAPKARLYEHPEVVPQLTHLWQLPLGIMIEPHSGQVGASLRAMKLKLPFPP